MDLDHLGLAVTPPRATSDAVLRGPARILVVDDDQVLRGLEALILASAGHHVDTAENAETAWQALQGGDYDLLVTDCIMPGISGVDLVRRLRVAHFKLPVVMVSGTLNVLDLVKLSRDPRSHIHAFVDKPFAIAGLLSAVLSALASGTTDQADHLEPAKAGCLPFNRLVALSGCGSDDAGSDQVRFA